MKSYSTIDRGHQCVILCLEEIPFVILNFFLEDFVGLLWCELSLYSLIITAHATSCNVIFNIGRYIINAM